MPRATYALSSRQSKELSRGMRIHICIPTDLDWHSEVDPIRYVRERLDLPNNATIEKVVLEHVAVSPPDDTQTGEVAHMIGRISVDTYEGWTVDMRVLIAAIKQSQREVIGNLPDQWPGKIKL